MIDPRYFTTDASGNGSVTWRPGRPGQRWTITKAVVEESPSASGTVSILRDGQLLTSAAMQPQLSAVGTETLYPGQSITVQVVNGPPSTQIKATLHYEVTPQWP